MFNSLPANEQNVSKLTDRSVHNLPELTMEPPMQKPIPSRYGFTLIELMIVVLILGIIVAIAFPSYTQQIQKSRRADATSAVLEAAQQLERCFTRNNTYNNCTDVRTTSDRGFYSITPQVSGDGYGFVVEAEARGSQLNDTQCRYFTFTHRGIRGARTSSNATNPNCWGT